MMNVEAVTLERRFSYIETTDKGRGKLGDWPNEREDPPILAKFEPEVFLIEIYLRGFRSFYASSVSSRFQKECS